jgi:hypothetical protein
MRIGIFALLVLFAAPVFAETIYYAPQVTGKRERKNIRHFLYLKNLSGDKKAIYDQYGYTAHRIRLNEYGEVREQWTYYEVGKVFVFDSCHRLVDEATINPEHRRAWAYQRDVRGYDEDIGCDD